MTCQETRKTSSTHRQAIDRRTLLEVSLDLLVAQVEKGRDLFWG